MILNWFVAAVLLLPRRGRGYLLRLDYSLGFGALALGDQVVEEDVVALLVVLQGAIGRRPVLLGERFVIERCVDQIGPVRGRSHRATPRP